MLLVGAERAAVEDEHQLVAFALVGRPVDGEEPLRSAVDAEFSRASCSQAAAGGSLCST